MPVSIATRHAAQATKVLRCAEAGRTPSVATADDVLRDLLHYYRMMGFDVARKVEDAVEDYRLDLQSEGLDEEETDR